MSYLIFFLTYFLSSYFIFRLARKLNEKLAIIAWFPFLSDYLITRLAKKPFYWWIFMYLPLMNFYYDYVLWREIFKRFNRSSIYAIAIMIPVINWLPLILLTCFFKPPEIKLSKPKITLEEDKKEKTIKDTTS